jgi:hypothetical protein
VRLAGAGRAEEADVGALLDPGQLWDFRSSEVKEGKQAEFLMYESFPLGLVRCVGVRSEAVAAQAAAALAGVEGAPPIAVRPEWYF